MILAAIAHYMVAQTIPTTITIPTQHVMMDHAKTVSFVGAMVIPAAMGMGQWRITASIVITLATMIYIIERM